MVTFTREDRRGRVLEYHSQGMDTREIAKLLHMSFTDIAKILKDSDKEKESEQQRTRQEFLSSQAYTLFSEGSTLEEVAIALNLRQPQVTELYTEHWRLKGLYMLDQIYEEIKGDIGSFVNLYRLAKSACMNVQHVNRLIAIANNHLPSVEYVYETRKREAEDLEAEKRNSARIYQEINDKILSMRNMLDSI
jgi:hypothetical protein